jgi:lysine 2,3-aminomutase
VIVSGGDHLTLPPSKLRYYLDNHKAIDHVDVIRIGTRVPVTYDNNAARCEGVNR